MSAFLVVYDRRGKPLEPDRLTPMMDMLSHRGPDGSNYFIRDNLFISHHHLWITPEEFGRKQPFNNKSGNLVISFDGRLDNRDDLYKLVNQNNINFKTSSDAELCMMLYEKYGKSSFQKLIGPFSFLIADIKKNRITGARDPMSERGFYYYISQNLFIASSEEVPILKHPEISFKINEYTLSHFFALEPVSNGSTFFENINELLPGHYITVTGENHSIYKYYEFPSKSFRYRDEQEYHQHYRELLELGVNARMRCVTPVSIMLSGGIDSNSIAALAALNNPFDVKLKAISWTFDDMSECDERTYIDTACEMYGIEPIQFKADNLWPLKDFETYFQNPNSPLENIYRNLKQIVYQTCLENNSRVLFNGWYADSFYTGYNDWLIEMLNDVRLKLFISSILWLFKTTDFNKMIKEPAFRSLLRYFRKFKTHNRNHETKNWLTDFAIVQLNIQNNIQGFYKNYEYPQRLESLLFNKSYFSPASEHFNLSRHSIELECPYTDIRLVNYILNIPAYELFQRGIKKYIAKKALSKLLPQSILARNSNTSLTPLYKKGLRLKVRSSYKRLLQENNGWKKYVDEDWLFKQINTEINSERNEVIIWNCVSYNMWIQNLESIGLYKT